MRLFLDFFPIVLFFVAYKFWGIFPATMAAMFAAGAQIAFVWFQKKRVEPLLLATFVIITLLGGATLFFHNEAFIKWKPTAINFLLAIIFAGSHWVGQTPLIQRVLKQNIELPPKMWVKLNWIWATFFAVLGAMNIFVIYNFDTNTWVNFKLFGILGLTFVFIILQAIWLSSHVQPNQDSSSNSP
jgi:intracellular septation protein